MAQAGKKEAPTFMIEEAQIIFRNFKGEEGPYNTKGDRNFCVVLEEDFANQLVKDGWNVKYLDSREEGEPDVPYIQVRVAFEHRPPRVVMITSTSRTNLGPDSVDTLDYADIANADLICRGYEWEVQGKKGIKAYLQSLFVTVEEDALERKYGMGQPVDVED